jgi:uncharacterized damage-inducible protein DinB
MHVKIVGQRKGRTEQVEYSGTMDVFQLLDYDDWATAKLLEAVESLSPEQFVQEFAGSLSSVRQQFVHLLLVIDIYRARLAQESVPDVSPESFATPQDLIVYEAQVRRRLDDFINGLEANQLTTIQEYSTRRGLLRASVEQTLLQVVNHGTYHRGQIACLFKLHGVDFEDTDFLIWINQPQA